MPVLQHQFETMIAQLEQQKNKAVKKGEYLAAATLNTYMNKLKNRKVPIDPDSNCVMCAGSGEMEFFGCGSKTIGDRFLLPCRCVLNQLKSEVKVWAR